LADSELVKALHTDANLIDFIVAPTDRPGSWTMRSPSSRQHWPSASASSAPSTPTLSSAAKTWLQRRRSPELVMTARQPDSGAIDG
jgi:hypothetical protein